MHAKASHIISLPATIHTTREPIPERMSSLLFFLFYYLLIFSLPTILMPCCIFTAEVRNLHSRSPETSQQKFGNFTAVIFVLVSAKTKMHQIYVRNADEQALRILISKKAPLSRKVTVRQVVDYMFQVC